VCAQEGIDRIEVDIAAGIDQTNHSKMNPVARLCV